MKTVFGPIYSRRFGVSLGIDLSPMLKQCNFDCLYCELKKAKPITSMQEVITVEQVIQEIKEKLQEGVVCDVITLTANGEPTLYPHLAVLVDELKKLIEPFKKPPKLLLLSNGSLFYKDDIKKSMEKLDIVKFSLDAITPQVFRRIDRGHKTMDISIIIQGIKDFKHYFHGDLIAEVLFVKGVNDDLKEVQKIAHTLLEIAPTRVDLSTIDRPPAYAVQALSTEELYALATYFKGLCVFVAQRKKRDIIPQYYTEEQILQTLKLRPLCDYDIERLFDERSLSTFKKLQSQGQIIAQKAGGISFYNILKR